MKAISTAPPFWIALLVGGVLLGPALTAASETPSLFRRTPKIARLIGIDILTITDPATIEKLSQGDELNRLDSAMPTPSDLPWVMRRFFRNSRFWNDPNGYFMPMRSEQGNTRTYLDKKFIPGTYDSSDYVKKAADVLLDEQKMSDKNKDKTDKELRGIFVNAVGARFLSSGSGSFPTGILKTGLTQIKSAGESFVPFRCPMSRKGISKACAYVRDQVSEDDVKDYDLPDGFPIDVAHNVFAGSVHGANALRTLAKDPNQDISTVMCVREVLVEKVPRITLEDSTLGGIVPSDDPVRGKKTVIFLAVGDASRETEKLAFAFGSGTKKRRCAAEPAILEFMKGVQKELKGRV